MDKPLGLVVIVMAAVAQMACLSPPDTSVAGGDGAAVDGAATDGPVSEDSQPACGSEPASSLSDTFDDEALASWEQLLSADCEINTSEGALTIRRGPSSDGPCALRSTSSYQLDGDGAILKIASGGIGDASPDLSLRLELAGRTVEIARTLTPVDGIVLMDCVDGDDECFRMGMGGCHPFWRLRYDAALQRVVGDCSADGITFSAAVSSETQTEVDEVACVNISVGSFHTLGNGTDDTRLASGLNTLEVPPMTR